MWKRASKLPQSSRVGFDFRLVEMTNEMLTIPTEYRERDVDIRNAAYYSDSLGKNKYICELWPERCCWCCWCCCEWASSERKLIFSMWKPQHSYSCLSTSATTTTNKQTKEVFILSSFFLLVVVCFRRLCRTADRVSILFNTKAETICKLCDFHKFYFVQKTWARQMKTIKWCSIRSVGFIRFGSSHVVLLFAFRICFVFICFRIGFWEYLHTVHLAFETFEFDAEEVCRFNCNGFVDVRTKIQLATDS